MRKRSLLLLFITWTAVFLGNLSSGYAYSCYQCGNYKTTPECSYQDTDLPSEKTKKCESDKAIGCMTIRLSGIFFRQCQLEGEIQCYQKAFDEWNAHIQLANGKCDKYHLDTIEKVQKLNKDCAHSTLDPAQERAQKEFKGLDLYLCFCDGENCNDLDMTSGPAGGGVQEDKLKQKGRASSVAASWTLSTFLIAVISIWK